MLVFGLQIRRYDKGGARGVAAAEQWRIRGRFKMKS